MVSPLNKTYRKSVLRSVRSSRSRFFAILAIVALGVGFLSGLLASPLDMRGSAEAYYDDKNMYDLKIASTLGLDADDLAAVRAVAGVAQVVPARDTDLVLDLPDGSSATARVQTLAADFANGSGDLNGLTLVSGRLPQKPGECVVIQRKSFGDEGLAAGDQLTVSAQNKDLADGVPAAFTVVGTVKSPLYLSMEREHTTVGTGSLSLFLYTPLASFDYDYYTTFYIAVDGARALDSFGDAYDARVGAVADLLEAMKPAREQARTDAVIGEAQQKLDDAQQEYADKKAEAEQKLADARAELDDGARQLADGKKQLADAKKQIDDGQLALDRAKDNYNATVPALQKQVADGYAQLDAAAAQADAGETQLAAAESALAAQDAQITALEQGKQTVAGLAAAMGLPLADSSDAAVQAALPALLASPLLDDTARAQLTALGQGLAALAAQGTTTEQSRAALTAGAQQFAAERQTLADGRAELARQRAALDSQAAQLDSQSRAAQEGFAAADEELVSARADYARGVRELAANTKKLADGEADYAQAKAEADEKLADAAEQIADAQSKVRDIGTAEWYIWDRGDNTSYASYDSNAEKIGNIAKVFPVFFFLVAALVALTTMTRMVEEERLQIGTLKALGYSGGQIAAKYLLYALAASAAGSVIGMTAGMQVFPQIIVSAYNIMYDVPRVLTPFRLRLGLLAAAAATACTLAATLSACLATLREVPARLMLPRAPKAGRRILLEYLTPVWRRMSFTHKVTARNLLRYKKRFFMTVAGIAGCTALLVTGFGVRDSISDIVEKQFSQITRYELTVGLKDASALDGSALQAVLNDKTRVADWTAALQTDGKVVPTGSHPADSLTIFVPQDTARLGDFLTFRNRLDHRPVTFDDSAVVITEKLAERQGLKVGDTLTVSGPGGKKADFRITGICENYVYHYLYLPAAAYEKAFGEAPQPNTVLCRLGPAVDGDDADSALSAALISCRDVSGTQFTTEISASFERSLTSIDFIVVVLIVSAAALAFVVLYNLTNINITEREKEIATIKVLGFYDREVSSYIYRETSVLTVIGILAGLAFGVALHQFVIRTAEIDMVMFGRAIYAPSYLWASLLTLVFTVLVDLVMRRKLRRISMVESMKAPE